MSSTACSQPSSTIEVPKLFGTRDRFRGGQFLSGGGEDGSGGNASDGQRQTKLCSPAAHLLLCGLVPNRLRAGTGLWPGSSGPLLCNVLLTFKHPMLCPDRATCCALFMLLSFLTPCICIVVFPA